MSADIWIVREPSIDFQEWLQVVAIRSDFSEVTTELAQSELGNLLHLADSQNHWYWLAHPKGLIVPFSFTRWGIYVALNDEFTISEAKAIAHRIGASVTFQERSAL